MTTCEGNQNKSAKVSLLSCCYVESDCRHCLPHPPTNATRHRFTERGFYHCGEPGLIICGFCHRFFVCAHCKRNRRINRICGIESCLMSLSCRIESERHTEVTHCLERHYQCRICQHRFKQESALRRHLSNSHPDAPSGTLDDHLLHRVVHDEDEVSANVGNRLVVAAGEFLSCFVCLEQFHTAMDLNVHLVLRHLKLTEEEKVRLLKRKYNVGETIFRDLLHNCQTQREFRDKLCYFFSDIMLGFVQANEMRMETAGNKLRFCFTEIAAKLAAIDQNIKERGLKTLVRAARSVLKEFDEDFAIIWRENLSLKSPATRQRLTTKNSFSTGVEERIAEAMQRLAFCSCFFERTEDTYSGLRPSTSATAQQETIQHNRSTCPKSSAIVEAFSASSLRDARSQLYFGLVNTVLGQSSMSHIGKKQAADEQFEQLHLKLLETMSGNLLQLTAWRIERICACAERTIRTCSAMIESLWITLRQDAASRKSSAVTPRQPTQSRLETDAARIKGSSNLDARSKRSASTTDATSPPKKISRDSPKPLEVLFEGTDANVLPPNPRPRIIILELGKAFHHQQAIKDALAASKGLLGAMQYFPNNQHNIEAVQRKGRQPHPNWIERDLSLRSTAKNTRDIVSIALVDWINLANRSPLISIDSSLTEALQSFQSIASETNELESRANTCAASLAPIVTRFGQLETVLAFQAAVGSLKELVATLQNGARNINEACLKWLRDSTDAVSDMPPDTKDATRDEMRRNREHGNTVQMSFILATMKMSSSVEAMFDSIYRSLTWRLSEGKGFPCRNARSCERIRQIEEKIQREISQRLGLANELPQIFIERRRVIDDAVLYSVRAGEAELRRIWQLWKLQEKSSVIHLK